jgi:hypothetical protein
MDRMEETATAAEITPPTQTRSSAGPSPTKVTALVQPGATWFVSMRRRVLPPTDDLVKALIVAVAYYLGAELAFWIGTLSYFFAPLWPPNMILFAALLGAPYRAWWLYVALAFPAHAVAEMGIGMQALPLVGAFACNIALALIAAAGIRQFSNGPPWIDSLAKVWRFLGIATLGAPMLVAVAIALLAVRRAMGCRKYPRRHRTGADLRHMDRRRTELAEADSAPAGSGSSSTYDRAPCDRLYRLPRGVSKLSGPCLRTGAAHALGVCALRAPRCERRHFRGFSHGSRRRDRGTCPLRLFLAGPYHSLSPAVPRRALSAVPDTIGHSRRKRARCPRSRAGA